MNEVRITGGSARGRTLRVPEGGAVRPTSSRVREALFSIVGQDLGGLRVLDAFGGSGLLALEAWSRGARVVCVERDPRHAAVIRTNVAALRADVEVVQADVLARVSELGRFDGALVDPPYALAPGPILDGLAPWIDGWLVFEAAGATHVPGRVEGLVRDRPRRFGDTTLHVLRRGGAGDGG